LRTQLTLLLIAAALVASAIVEPHRASAFEQQDSACTKEGILEARDLPRRAEKSRCDLTARTIRDAGPTILVPPPGERVYAEWLSTTGSQEFQVATEHDGTVVLDMVGEESEGESTGSEGGAVDLTEAELLAAALPSECEDKAYNHNYWTETTNFEWRFRSSTTPSGVSITAAADDLNNGYLRGPTAYNACGMEDHISANNTYRGNTDLPSRIDSEGNCTQWDNSYVVDFGNLPTSPKLILGKACVKSQFVITGVYEVTEADIKFNRQASWFAGGIPTGCVGKYSIDSIMAHEAGHVYGLAHVSEAEHPELTGTLATLGIWASSRS
jgi:hypothetical protein